MRTTLRIDDDLMAELKRAARDRDEPISRVVNRVLRRGLAGERAERSTRPPHREETHAMGAPLADLTKALAVAEALEEDEVRRELERRK